jgi:predicted Fe-Mo cluster-binding NifX family protein
VDPEPKPELPEPEPQNPKPESQLPPPPPEVAAATKDGNISDKEADAVVDALSADGKITNAEVASLVAALAPKGQELTQDQKDLVADVIVEQFKGENAVPASALEAAGIEFKDLPEETPVEVRQDENGNEVIITADVAAALVLLENPSELIGAIFSDPSQALQAFANIGADMSTQEREESTKAVVATVIAAGAAINAVGAAAGAAGGSTGGSTGGGGASGESGYRRRKP